MLPWKGPLKALHAVLQRELLKKPEAEQTIMKIKNWFRELHRRSLWQVTGAYAATSWAVLNVVDVVTGLAGLPDWTPSMAIVLLLLGFPVIIATAIIQNGTPASEAAAPSGGVRSARHPGDVYDSRPSEPSRDLGALFSWRNALVGGLGAGLLLMVSGGAYLVMWNLGIGPAGSLVAAGVLDSRDPVLLAQFDDRTSSGDLGIIVSEALAVDLSTSRVVSILGQDATAVALQLMGQEERTPVTSELAREVALRANVKAFIEGEVTPIGSRFLVVARIVSSRSGDVLGSFREEAGDEDGLLPAIDRLSQSLRERLGESLRDIRLGAPLEEVTTTSFEALRKLSQAEIAEEEGDYELAERLLQEAIVLDPQFAMAYRKISVLLSNRGGPDEFAREAAARAFEFRDRLTERERYLTEANYHNVISEDQAAALRAYDALLNLYPNDPAALNNSGLALRRLTRFDEALTRFDRAVENAESYSAVAFFNRALTLFTSGNTQGAVEAVEAYRSQYPSHIYQPLADLIETLAVGEVDGVEGRIRALQGNSDLPNWGRLTAPVYQMSLASESGALERAFEWAEIFVPEQAGAQAGIPAIATGAADLEFWLLDEREQAATTLQSDYQGRLQAVDPSLRPWAGFIVMQAMAGEVDVAREWLEDWDTEARASTTRSLAHRRVAQAMINWAEGQAGSALAEIESVIQDLECTRCFERERAFMLEDLERYSDAIEIWELVRGRPLMLVGGFERAVAVKNLARLYEVDGRREDAISAHRALVGMWASGGDRLQTQVEGSRERIAELGG